MTDTLFQYESHSLNDAITRITALLDNTPEGKAKEFYLTISEVLTTLSHAIDECQTQRKAYDKMCRRIEIMEAALSLFLKAQNGERLQPSGIPQTV